MKLFVLCLVDDGLIALYRVCTLVWGNIHQCMNFARMYMYIHEQCIYMYLEVNVLMFLHNTHVHVYTRTSVFPPGSRIKSGEAY